jgi:hypothetical protein
LRFQGNHDFFILLAKIYQIIPSFPILNLTPKKTGGIKMKIRNLLMASIAAGLLLASNSVLAATKADIAGKEKGMKLAGCAACNNFKALKGERETKPVDSTKSTSTKSQTSK